MEKAFLNEVRQQESERIWKAGFLGFMLAIVLVAVLTI